MKKITNLCVGALVFLSHVSHATLEPEQRNELIRKFAPLVKFHEREQYFPSSVPWLIVRSELRALNPGDQFPSGLFSKARIHESSTTLNFSPKMDLVSKVNSTGLKTVFGSVIFGVDPSRYFLTPKGSVEERNVVFRGENLIDGKKSPAPVYASLVEKPEGAVIQYVFFYPYNGPPFSCLSSLTCIEADKRGIHEGDVEHLDVHLVKTEGGYELNEAYFARHGASKYGSLHSVDDIEIVEETHPVVYAALRGHASYPHHFRGFSSTLDRTGSNGPQWESWNNVIDVGTLEQPAPGQEWIKFEGRWGYDGVSGPAQQDWWRVHARQTFPIKTIQVDLKKRSSSSFSLAIPPRFRKLSWRINHPRASEMEFSVHHRTACCGSPVFDSLPGQGVETGLPSSTSRLSISDLRVPQDLGSETSVEIIVEALEE